MAASVKTRRQEKEKKRRQRQKLKQTSYNLGMPIPKGLKDDLEICKALGAGSSFQEVVIKALEAYRTEHFAALAPLMRLALAYWPKIRPLRPYSVSLQKPGTMIRINTTVYRADDWLALQPVWSQMQSAAKHHNISGDSLIPFFDMLVAAERRRK